MNVAALLAPTTAPLPPPPPPAKVPERRLHIGTFIAPRTPFPVAFPAHCTVLVPRVVARSSFETGVVFGSGPYTDDSDVLLAALHSARLSTPHSSAAPLRDAVLDLRVWPKSANSRFSGSPSHSGIVSHAWPGVHDGGSFEVVSARWVDNQWPTRADSTTRALARRANRKQRIGEYSARRDSVLGRAVTSADLHPTLVFPNGIVGYKFNRAVVRDTLFAPLQPHVVKRRRWDTSIPVSHHSSEPGAPEPFMRPDDRPDVILRCATSGTSSSTTVILRPEPPSHVSCSPRPAPPAHVNMPVKAGSKRKRSQPSSSYTVLVRHGHSRISTASTQPENALPFEEPPASRDEQMRRFGAQLRGLPISTVTHGPRWAPAREPFKKLSVPPSPETVVGSATSSDDNNTVLGIPIGIGGPKGFGDVLAAKQQQSVVVLSLLENEPFRRHGETAVLEGMRESDVEVLADGLAIWMGGRVCYLRVRSWTTRHTAAARH
ncbi:hypothetical protein BKA62DRAFT_688264 [Auriculariales sp. MPI-PUGE-AT-0066]|nr:hypothetical protein BKA62DRAFT_688264 [Auriculariales sp. MPI-PUGE-AT-0066]